MPRKFGDGEQSLSTGRKRKQSPLQLQPVSCQQNTISEPFLSKPAGISQAKRPKTPIKIEKLKPLTQATMLNFSTKQPAIIDLTSSPPPPPILQPLTTSRPVKPSSLQPHSGARKLVVKNLKKTSKRDSETYFHSTWALLEKVLGTIFRKEKIPMSMEELYRGVENLCRVDRAPVMYEKLRACCDEYVGTQLKPQILAGVGGNTFAAVRIIEAAWRQWRMQLV